MAKQPTLSSPATARLLIVDDHPAVREGLAIRLARQADLTICGEADDIASALELVAATKPDIVIVDISLKGGNGLDLIKRLKQRDSSVRLLVWSMYPDSLYAERAMRAGAMGYINKEQATDRIVEAIQHVLAGKVYLSTPMSERVLIRAVSGDSPTFEHSPVESLSDRELECFRMIGLGQETAEIAREMHVSPKTVETYRARIKEKLRLVTGRQLLQAAIQWVLEFK